MPAIPDQAICLRQWDWSETSQTVSLFTREHGLVRALAKGAKRENAAFSGGIDPLTRGQAMLILKPSADLATLTAWDLQEIFPPLRRSLPTFYTGMYIADLVHHLVQDRDPHPAFFDQLLAALRTLGPAEHSASALLRLQWAALVEAGYRPELDADVSTGALLEPAAAYSFAPRLGGFTVSPVSPSWRVRSETLILLRAIAEGQEPSGPSVERANRLLAAYTREILGREIPAASPLFGDLAP